MTLAARLERWVAQGALSALDVAFARFVQGLAAADDPSVGLAAALVSRELGRGHVCLDLTATAGRVVLPGDDDEAGEEEPVTAPALARWRRVLENSGVVGPDRPLVLDGAGRLYLARYWRYEQALATALRGRADRILAVDAGRLAADLDRLFAASDRPDGDQRRAVVTAAMRGLCVVSGGPGTGKTSTVVRIVAALLRQGARPLEIALAAPTGKAAARMQEAVRLARAHMGLEPAELARVPDQVRTIHRLLGVGADGVTFRHGPSRRLGADVVIVDEASMIDVSLMVRLVEAVRDDARLILLGDRDQLASVEAGAVLGDLCAAAEAQRESALAACVVLLQASHRFDAASGIGRLARAVNAGDVGAVRRVLEDPTAGDVARADGDLSELEARARRGFAPFLASVRHQRGPEASFAAFAQFRLLCAHRHGPAGAETINARLQATFGGGAPWYAGRPILVTQNDYALRLFNGDVGLVLPDSESGGRLRVFFEGDGGRLRRLHPLRLPPHETTYAMTVHKSQGSEFHEVLLVLPPETSRLLTRELLYTGLTRARRRVTVWGAPLVFAAGVERRLVRASGLRDALGGA